MDLVCIRCGEPWSVACALHAEPYAFKRKGGLIQHCPACPDERPQLEPATRRRLGAVAVAAELLGDDVDGLAAVLEDSGLL